MVNDHFSSFISTVWWRNSEGTHKVRFKTNEAHMSVCEQNQAGSMLSILICRRTVLAAKSVTPATRRSDGRAEEYG